MVEIAVAVAAKVAQYLVAPIVHQCTYFCNYKRNFEKLRTDVQKLRDARESLQHRIDDAKRNGENIEQKVENWLIRFDKIMQEAGRTIEDAERARNRLFPNLKNRYRLTKKAMREVEVVAELLQEEGKFSEVSYRTIPEDICLTSIKGFEAFESRMSTLNEILNALNNPDINMIGMCGMGGIGKTTLVKEVARQAMNDKLFDEVVYAEVSQTPKVKNIQGQIADKLELKFFEESESGRARKLYQRLKKEKKILVILDNIWTKLDFEKVGIPFGDRGCKVLMTARSQDVLSSEMDCQLNFLVGTLNEGEAWNLFKKVVGDCIENNDLQCVAVDIVKVCSGLPIAIVTIARALRNKNLFVWKNALRELRRPSSSSFAGVPAEAYRTIELSYKHLQGEELKSTFLLCSLMEYINSASIPYLLSYGMGLGLFKGINTMEEARDRVHALVDKLKNSCLLLDGRGTEDFSMHDVVRDVAISIASRDENVFVMNNEARMREWPDKDSLKDLKDCTAISLPNCKISELVEGLECPQLKFFHVSPKEPFIKISDNFFTGMTELRVLDFMEMHLFSLPSSLHLLVNLQTLCLEYGVFGDVAIIGELKKLEILSLEGSNIESLPREIGQLTQLRSLNLTACYQLKVIPSNVISNLSLLEELYMGHTFVQWETEGRNSTERSNASLHELKHLSQLTTLEIHIQDAKVLPKGLLTEKLERYIIFIGDEWDWYYGYENKRTLKLKINTSICLKDEVFLQLKGVEELCLDEVQGVNNVLYELDREGFPKLKYLDIQNNPCFLCIIDSNSVGTSRAFPLMESLSVSNLVNLENICCGQLKFDSFCRLRILKVKSCDKLRNIFSFSIARSLPQLQTIEVIACENLKEVFAVGRDDDINNSEEMDKIEFSQLRKLTLKSLPQLRSFCTVAMKSSTLQSRQELMIIGTSSIQTIGASSNEVIEDEIDTSAPFFNEKVAFPNLDALKLSAINSEKIWHNQLPATSSCIQNLTRLIVRDCGNLKYIFSTSIVRGFVQLQHLEICNCKDLEEIVFLEQLIEEESQVIMFPQLNFLKIKCLDNLTRFYSGNYIELPSLKVLEIEECPELKAFILKNIRSDMSSMEIQPFFNEKVAFPSLEEMVLSNMDNLKMIWHDQFVEDSFCKLKLLEVEYCYDLLTIFPPNMFARLSKLESLIVTHCYSLEEIFDLQGINFEETSSGAVCQLRELKIFGLPKLKNVWNKDPQRMLIFQHLVLVRIFDCESLKNVFPVSIAKSLPQLEMLYIKNCGVEEIVANEGRAVEATARFFFPNLSSLRLWKLRHLTTFYSGIHTLELPDLKKLEVYGCDRLKIFNSECQSFQEINEGQRGIPAQQPLFWVEKVFPNLEELALSEKELTIIWQPGQRSKLKILHVIFDESADLPVGLLQNIHNLDKLVLTRCPHQEIFTYREVEEHAERLTQIKNLKLKQRSNKEQLWKTDSKFEAFLQNLEILELVHIACNNLPILVPSSASFQNLIALKISRCKGAVSLAASSTAKSLLQLREMRISSCYGMTAVVANDTDEGDEIVFSKLNCLFLEDLPSLTSFCSGNHAFNFPSLEGLIVTRCRNMNIFSAGVTKAPRLREVHNGALNEGCWSGDLNTTIQRLHEKMAKPSKTQDSEDSTSEETDDEANKEDGEEDGHPMILSISEEEEYEYDSEEIFFWRF